MLGFVVLGAVIAGLVVLARREDVIESGRSLAVSCATLAVGLAGLVWWAAETPLGPGERGVVRIVTSCSKSGGCA